MINFAVGNNGKILESIIKTDKIYLLAKFKGE